MSVDGTWNLVMQTPLGERKSTLMLKSAGGAVTGTLAAEGNSTEIKDGKTSGNSVSWKASIKNPMPLTLEFTGTVDGGKISGNVSAGAIGSWPFSGSKA
ncbi:MAG: hypothetical protein F9K29_23545 [Hyphomicrobiaceae bacterium]|nr:MAG: hypothetical protein F9K29_23545 [Hyphomicrobiaceae bacterium]